MNKKRVCDTSILISFVYANDSLHAKACEIFAGFDLINDEIILTDHVIQETISILTYKGGIDLAQKFWRFFHEQTRLYIHTIDIEYLIQRHFQLQKKISLADASVILTSLQLNTPCITFDAEQYRLYQRLCS